MSQIQLEILEANYWEHFKMAKDLALIFPINNQKRKLIEKTIDSLQIKIEKLRNEI